jgi:aspartate-semialdehyde dehydrogenase
MNALNHPTKNKMKLVIGIVGATGAAGQTALDLLAGEFPNFELKQVKAYASRASAGKKVYCGRQQITVEELKLESLSTCDALLFATEAEVSERWIPKCAELGIFCVDKSSAFRMKSPLIVPEINPEKLQDCLQFPVAATPNCCATPLAMVIAALDKAFGVDAVVVSTYQSVSGSGKPGMDVLREETLEFFSAEDLSSRKSSVYPKSIAFNVFPYVSKILDDGNTEEESKIIMETQKILNRPNLLMSATSVRVPTFVGHAESVTLSLSKQAEISNVKSVVSKFPGVVLVAELGDNEEILDFPTPREVTGKDFVYVGRVRKAEAMKNGVSLWLACDNLRKGAALNALQIVDACVAQGVLSEIQKKYKKS